MNKQLIFLPLFLAIVGYSAFLRTPGFGSVRAVQVVLLLGTGMCLGVGLAHLGVLLRGKSRP